MIIQIIGSGSKGNATIIRTTSCNILIDAGLNLKNIEDRINKVPKIDIVIITHIHTDHTKGLKSIIKQKPIIYTMCDNLEEIIKYDKINNEKKFTIKDTQISFIELSHDTPCHGIIIKDNNKELVYITDTGYINRKILKEIENKDAYIMESNHDVELLRKSSKPFFLQQRILSDKGHLSNDQAAKYLKTLIGNKTKYIFLAHLSEENNTEEIVRETIEKMLKTIDNNVKEVYIANQKEALKAIEV